MKIFSPKALQVSSGTNFWFSVMVFIVLSFNLIGIDLDIDTLNSVISAIATKKITTIIGAMIGLGMMIYNVVKNLKETGKFSEIWKYKNFWTGLAVLIGDYVAWKQYGTFPMDEAQQLIESIFSGGNLTAVITAAWVFLQSFYIIVSGKDKIVPLKTDGVTKTTTKRAA